MLFRKFLRDVWNNKIQFISIFIMAALSSYIFAGMGSLYNGLDYELGHYYNNTNFADYIMYAKEGFSEEDIAAIDSISGVNEVDVRYVYRDAIAYTNHNSKISINVVDEDYKVSKCIVIEGEPLQKDTEAIWLDARYAKENDIEVGDYIGLILNETKIERKVRGLVINPEYLYQVNADNIVPNHKDIGYAFMTYQALEKLGIEIRNQLVIDVKEDIELTEEDILKKCNTYDIFQTRDDIAGHVMFNQAIEQYKAIGIIFPIAFLAVTILTMLTTITRLVDKQRIEIGTLGTLGLKKSKIYRHYISFGFFPALVGCLVGVAAAPFTLPYTFYVTLDSLYTMERWVPRLPFNSLIIVIVCIFLCVLVTFITIRRVLKETPAQAIKPKVSKEIDQSKILQSEIVSKMTFSFKWNLIDLLKGKTRMIMTVVGMAGCMGLLIAGFGFRDCLDDVVETQYNRIYKFETKLVLDLIEIAYDKDGKIVNDIEKRCKDVEYIYEGQVDIKREKVRKLTNIIVHDDLEHIEYYNEKAQKIELSKDKIDISRKIAKYLGVTSGDYLKIKLFGTKGYKQVKVGNIYVSPITQGIIIHRSLYESLGYTYTSNYALTSTKNIDEDMAGILNIITKDKLRCDYETTKETLDTISFILLVSAVVLAIVVLYNLNMLSLYEKQNEFALLKVLGFKSSRIRNLLLRQTLFLVVIGVIVGVPFGIGLLYLILNTMGDSVDMSIKISAISYIVSIMITCGLSIVLNLLFIIHIKKIDMVSSLKHIE